MMLNIHGEQQRTLLCLVSPGWVLSDLLWGHRQVGSEQSCGLQWNLGTRLKQSITA